MEGEFFLNAGISPAPPLPLHFDPLSSSSAAADYQSLDCYFGNPNWERSTDHGGSLQQFESALSSMASSPAAAGAAAAASNSNHLSADSFMIRELIGKLGSIGGGEISPHLAVLTSANNSCYSTPMNSPPPPIGLNSATVAEFSTDPGFAERAARFSCFGSRSFNGRTVQPISGGLNGPPPAAAVGGGVKLPRISSSPSLKVLGFQKGNQNCGRGSPSPEESSLSTEHRSPAVADHNPRKRKAAPKGKSARESPSQANATAAKEAETSENHPNAKRSKGAGEEEPEQGAVEEKQSKKGISKAAAAAAAEPLKDYIHVRARRGQATDSHSLAERVRREKISERMKFLQDLVPGCNKVTGKALMLDEIINYVQSLQRQVEFLSMKMASVNTTRLDFNVESLPSKEMFRGMSHPMFPMDDSSAVMGHRQIHRPMHGSDGGSGGGSSDQNLLSLHCQLPPLDSFHHDQFPTFCDDDLQSIVQMATNVAEGAYLGSSLNHQAQASSHMKAEI